MQTFTIDHRQKVRHVVRRAYSLAGFLQRCQSGTVGSGPYRDTVSYYRLNLYVANIASRLNAVGVRPGETYGLRINDVLLHIVAMLAIEWLGAATVSLTPAANPKELGLLGVLHDDTVPDEGVATLPVDLGMLDGDGAFLPECPSDPMRGQVRRVILTSGTTGTPKGVPMTDEMIEERVSTYSFAFGSHLSMADRLLCCMGMASSLGYLFLIHTLARGGMYCVPDEVIEKTVNRISFYAVDGIIAPPNVLARLASYAEQDSLPFPPVKFIATAGSMLPKSIEERVRARLCGNLISLYGSTEVGMIAVGATENLDIESGQVGVPIPGVVVDVIDDGEGVPQGFGRLRIRGRANAQGYIGTGADNAEVFIGGWFVPGDIGYISPEGILTLGGRQDNVVNLGGIKTTFEELEKRLSGGPSVREVAVAVMTDADGASRPVAVIVPDAAWNQQRFEDYCNTRVEFSFRPARVVVVDAMPRLASGKIDRQKLRNMV